MFFSFFPFFISTKQNDKGHRVNTILQSKHSWRFHKQLSFLPFPHFQISSVFLFRFPQFLNCISLGSGLAVYQLWTISFSVQERQFWQFWFHFQNQKAFLNSFFGQTLPWLVGESKNIFIILLKGVQQRGPFPALRLKIWAPLDLADKRFGRLKTTLEI